MFWSKGYAVIPLDESDEFEVRQEGLKYSNHDICYPFVLMAGQVVRALRSGKYDPKKTFILMPTAGDACRGACYLGLMRRSLDKSHFEDVRVMTINVRHVRDDIQLKITLDTAIRGLFGLFYGDILMLLANQVRPYEVNKGETDALYKEWIEKLSEDLRLGKNLTLGKMKKNFRKIAESFSKIERDGKERTVVGVVAEFYVKYCGLGNWDLVKYLEENGAEAHVNGVSWYMLYYIDSHKPAKHNLERLGFEVVKKLMASCQNDMIDVLHEYGFHCLNKYEDMAKGSEEYVSHTLTIGDGWLLGAEVCDYAHLDYKKVLCIAPFGCMANVCAGRGLYPHLQRKFPNTNIAVVETDSSSSKLNYYNRVQMLIK
jgi:predicted nucleotide-binding protein (sugar kinase/HSP70/actin superfamily)